MTRTAFATTALTLTLGAAAALNTAGAVNRDGPFTCAIEQSSTGAMTVLTSRVRAETSANFTGSYRFAVTGPGTNIRQGGGFVIEPGQTKILGTVMLSGAASQYDASLTVTANGGAVECQRVRES